MSLEDISVTQILGMAFVGAVNERHDEHKRLIDLQAENAELRKQLADAEKDATRYRFLAGVDVPQSSTRWSRWRLEYWQPSCGGWNELRGAALNAAIDATLVMDTAC